MNDIREFVRSGGGAVSDSDLMTMVRAGMLMSPLDQQRSWLREVDLALDAYGHETQTGAAVRVRDALRHLEAELKDG